MFTDGTDALRTRSEFVIFMLSNTTRFTFRTLPRGTAIVFLLIFFRNTKIFPKAATLGEITKSRWLRSSNAEKKIIGTYCNNGKQFRGIVVFKLVKNYVIVLSFQNHVYWNGNLEVFDVELSRKYACYLLQSYFAMLAQFRAAFNSIENKTGLYLFS